MVSPHTETYQYLLMHYGPLLTLKHLAEVMHSSPNGVRMAITRRQQPMAVGLAFAKRRIGRRVFFDARLVADIIDESITTNQFQITQVMKEFGSTDIHKSKSPPPLTKELVQRD